MSAELDPAELKPLAYGHTWERNEDGSWHLPQYTLGWKIAGWCTRYLRATKGSGPWVFTPEQLRFILWWYAVDSRGEFIYRTGVLQRLKGWGKDPLVAVMCLVELVGPSSFGGWDENGEPIGVARTDAWVQVAAVSKDQTRNTMTLFPTLMSDEFIATYGIKDGAELIRANGGRQRLEAVTSSYRALEGGRSTFVVLNETHHWVAGNDGDKMYETVDGNISKMDGRYLAITNAYLPGEDSVAERMREDYEHFLDGTMPDTGFLYDTLEADPRTPMTVEALRKVIPIIRGDAVWLKVETILASIQKRSIALSRSRRMWLNQIVTDEDSLHEPGHWDSLWDRNAGTTPEPGDSIVLGFDGGKTDDDTALVAIRTTDMVAFVLHHQHKPDGPSGDGWEVDRVAADSAVHEAFRLYAVQGFYADVALWESYIADWAEAYGEGLSVKAEGRNAISWDMRSSLKRVTMAHERLMNAVWQSKLRHSGDRMMKRHALNARRRNNNYGVSFGKEGRESPRKVDIYAALLLAHECLYDLRTRGAKKKARTGRGYFL